MAYYSSVYVRRLLHRPSSSLASLMPPRSMFHPFSLTVTTSQRSSPQGFTNWHQDLQSENLGSRGTPVFNLGLRSQVTSSNALPPRRLPAPFLSCAALVATTPSQCYLSPPHPCSFEHRPSETSRVRVRSTTILRASQTRKQNSLIYTNDTRVLSATKRTYDFTVT